MLTALHSDGADKSLLCDYAYHRLRWHAHRDRQMQASSTPCVPLQPLLDAIQSNPGLNLSIDDMCEQCGVSAPYLHALFRRHLNTTPHQFVLDRRLQHARQLIVSTDKPIKEISQLCGFDHLETFHRCFKKRFLLSPLAYQRSNLL